MTRSYGPETCLDASARELLESVNSLILQEARKARPGENGRISSVDILDSLGKRQARGRWRQRAEFAGQVTLTAIAISATMLSFAVARLIAGGDDATGSGAVSTSRSLFTTALLATLLIVSVTILFTVFREPKEGLGKKWQQSRIKTAWPTRSSRRETGIALLNEWSNFEQLMKRELYADPDYAPNYNLSGDIIRFSRRYDLNPEEIRSILRSRNAVAHDPRATSPAEVRENLLRLQSTLEKLSPLQPMQ